MRPATEERLATREVDMKKFIFIIILSAALSGCASPSGMLADEGSLLSFADLANEITVGFEEQSPAEILEAEIEGPLGTP